jgi:DNA-binding transcriptional MocR family regulator
VLWVEMPAGVDSIELYQQALKERIGISPGPMFSASNRYRNCLRINCGIAWSDRAERALARIGELAYESVLESAPPPA